MNTIKTKIKLLSLLVVVLSTSSCEKFLTIDSPDGVSDEQWWNTETDGYNALGTVYAGIPGGSSGRNIMYYAGLTDEAVQRGDFKGDYDGFTRGLASSRWGVSNSLWADDYTCIRRANRFLENIDGAYIDAELKERMKLEARALRAYYHMELMLVFGDIPLLTQSLTPTENQSSRTAQKEVYDFIVAELKDCAAKLPASYVNADRWRMTSGVCLSLLSRLGLYYKDFELAKASAKQVIDSKVYKLWISTTNKNDSYSELFSYAGELNDERIFFKENGCANAWTSFAPFGIGGETYLSPTNTVVNNFETKQGKTIQELGRDSVLIYQRNPNYKNNRDPRLAASVFSPNDKFQNQYTLDPFYNPTDKIGETKSTATGYWIKKYIDARDRQAKSGSLDFMIIRYAEILLNYAEAMIETGQWSNAETLAAINEVRARAAMPAVNSGIYGTQAKMRDLIRRERQAELAFEGSRYFDIRRWGIDEAVMNGEVFGATNPKTGELVRVQSRMYKRNREGLWPIPEAEIIANRNMVQNPNY
ncbi:RagB/SusD family nutrient uptake outer membrane protein [Sphingobacterium sp. UBA5996]|uniref:RagB/SusD family nutrient uptake outer membrane protein n=1 Tax=Sphingobacterium sp. UBA5996 TaxID=1947505 RepID=UPI0025F92ADE|nr:RagB/SusD family nutrient uptake outer membrane protein [Sphingobacterium sp. UBA5996]